MRKTIQIRLAALFGAAALILLCLPVGAASGPTVSAGNAVVTQGGAGTVIVSAQGLERLTSLQLEIAYDAQALSVTGAVTKSMDVATADCNTAGTIRYIGISMNGVSGANDLLEITFRANANATPGSYPIQVFAAGATADKGGGDEHVSVAVRAGTVTVQESGTVYFSAAAEPSAVETGELVTVTVSSWSLNDLAGGRFVFRYDSSLFAYQSLELLPAMTGAEYTHTVNAANEGHVTMSFVSDEAVRGGDLMRLTLRAKEHAAGTAEITMDAKDLTDVRANPLEAEAATTSVSVSEKARVWLQLPDAPNTHESFRVTFWVEGCSGLAAGDFSIGYDPTVLECLSVTSGQSDSSQSAGGYVVIDDAFHQGTIAFSVLYPQGISRDTCLVTAEFRTRVYTATEITLTTAAETTPVDRWNNRIVLSCDGAAGAIPTPDHLCVNGFCTVCEKEVISYVEEPGCVCAAVPGVEANGKVVLAIYGPSGKMIACDVQAPADGAYLRCDIPKTLKEKTISVFVLNDHWAPLRDPAAP